MLLRHLKKVCFGFMALSVTIASAQSETCPDIVTNALSAVDEFCLELGRNQACYGNVALAAEPQPEVDEFTFETLGDVVDVDNILSLELSELDEDEGLWGVVVMSLQADIPNTLPGQNVTFILFGDVTIENASSDEQSPMQAFYLRTGIGDAACEEAPESGLLVQTPDGVDEVTFNINGVDVQVGSTVLFQTEWQSDEQTDLLVSTVEGSAALQYDGESYPAVEGTQMRMPLNEQLLPVGLPELPVAYAEARLARLPINHLPRRIQMAAPMLAENIDTLQMRIQNGLPPCGVDGLPRCEAILPILQSADNLPTPERWGQIFRAGENCIAIPETVIDSVELPSILGSVSVDVELPFCPPTERDNRPPISNARANDDLNFEGDNDEDGVLNVDDACPLRAGTEQFSGCPIEPTDNDSDGIPDALDFCPNIAGERAYRGCASAPNDRDGDSIPDALDFCPNIAGVSEFRGCPVDPRDYIDEIQVDTDDDGIPDAVDNCPDEAGTAINVGCPRTQNDRDNDGFANRVDECPNYPGEFAGCPPDSDGDGLYDPQDECPDVVGTAANDGCPPMTPDPNGDFDGDTVPNGVDNCPRRAGTRENRGCP